MCHVASFNEKLSSALIGAKAVSSGVALASNHHRTDCALQLQFSPVAFQSFRQLSQKLHPFKQVRFSFGIGGSRTGELTGFEPITHCLRRYASLGVVLGNDFGLGLRDTCKTFFDDLPQSRMQLLAMTAQETGVGTVMDKRVLKYIGRVWRDSATKDEAGFGKVIKGGLQLRVAPACEGSQEGISEFPADDRPNLHDLLDRHAEAID